MLNSVRMKGVVMKGVVVIFRVYSFFFGEVTIIVRRVFYLVFSLL